MTSVFLLVTVASLRLPRIFSDGLVLQVWDQGDARSFVYGLSSPNTSVSLTISSANESLPFMRTYHTQALSTGSFLFQLDGTYTADPYGRIGPHYGPFTLVVAADGEEMRVQNVSFGDVFICVGDEDMALPMSEDRATASELSLIHRFVVAEGSALSSSEGIEGKWLVNTPISGFSALCYETAAALTRLNPAGHDPGSTTDGASIPIGVILATVNDSTLVDWLPSEVGGAACDSLKPSSPSTSMLYDSMIAPLSGLALRGVVLSLSRVQLPVHVAAVNYGKCLRTLINSWRDHGEIGDFSFAFTQSAPDVELQEAMMLALPSPFTEAENLSAVDTTSLAPTYDLQREGLRVRQQELGSRLALGLVHTAYAKQEPEWRWSAPQIVDAAVDGRGIMLTIRGEEQSLSLCLSDTSDCANCSEHATERCCCASGGGRLLEAYSAQWSTWIPAHRLELLPPTLDRSKQLLLARWRSNISMAHLADLRVRLGGSAAFGCVLRNRGRAGSLGMPVLPATMRVRMHRAQQVISTSSATDDHDARDSQTTQRGSALVMPPPMGFNSWNRFHCWVDERELKIAANMLVHLGLAAIGYSYLNIDDCWQASREWQQEQHSFNGSIRHDPARFPAGIRSLSAYAHRLGLKVGLYTSQTRVTCQARPGSFQHEVVDAAAYCEADVDYLKIDRCGAEGYVEPNSSWIIFRRALDVCAEKRGRKFLMSCSSCQPTPCLKMGTCTGLSGCGRWIASGPVSCDLWRTGNDIQAHWSSILANVESNDLMAPVQNSYPGHYNDPDILQVGNVGLTLAEQRSHFALWCVMGSPLLISTDLRQIDPEALRILRARELIAINQDTWRSQGSRLGPRNITGGEVWVKQLSHGRYGVVLLNRGESPASIELDLVQMCPGHSLWLVRDAWAGSDIGHFAKQYIASQIPSHDNVALLVTPMR